MKRRISNANNQKTDIGFQANCKSKAGWEEKSLSLKAKNRATVWTFLIFWCGKYKGVHPVEGIPPLDVV